LIYSYRSTGLQSKKDFVHGLHGFSLIKKYIIKIISLRNSAPRLPAGRRKIFAIFALNEYINPDMAHIYGIYRKKEVVLDTKHCASEDGLWLTRPDWLKIIFIETTIDFITSNYISANIYSIAVI
jgi:hypothetical protein